MFHLHTPRTANVAIFALIALGLSVAVFSGWRGTQTPDSVIYIDLARNVAAGKGLVHSYAPVTMDGPVLPDRFATPATLWAPLYPLTIAAFGRCGLPLLPAAHLLALAGVLGSVLVLVRWTSGQHDRPAAFALSIAALLYWPLWVAASTAWSEGLALAWLIAALATFAHGSAQNQRAYRGLLAAGVCAGLAAATRYALLPLGPFLAVALLARQRSRRGVRGAALLAGGWMLCVAPVLLRNAWHTGHPLGPPRPPAPEPFTELLRAALDTATGQWLAPALLAPATQARVLLVVLLVAVLVLILRRRYAALADAAVAHGRWLLLAWGLFYTLYIVAYRSLFLVDDLGLRLLLPGLWPLWAWAALLLAAIFAPPPRLAPRAAAAVAMAALAWAAATLLYALPAPRDSLNPATGAWLERHTAPGDVLVSTMPLELLSQLGGRSIVALWPSATTQRHLDHGALRAWAESAAVVGGAKVYLVVDNFTPFDGLRHDQATRWFGGFVAGLSEGDGGLWPGVEPLAALDDTLVYRLADVPLAPIPLAAPE